VSGLGIMRGPRWIFRFCHKNARLGDMRSFPSSILVALLLTALTPFSQRVFAQESEPPPETAAPTVTRGALETAVSALAEPIVRRVVVRNDQNLYDVWLISSVAFETMGEAFRQAVSTKRMLANGLHVTSFTWIAPDRSYVLDVAGGEKPFRLRLTRHLAGSMLELENAGTARDAPRWSPPYRPRPVVLPHGSAR